MTEEYDPEHSLLEIDWSADRPTSAELADARTAHSFLVPDQDEIVPAAARELETIMDDIHVNGGAHLGVIRVPPDETIDWFLSRNRLNDWLRNDVLASDALASALPALELPDGRHP